MISCPFLIYLLWKSPLFGGRTHLSHQIVKPSYYGYPNQYTKQREEYCYKEGLDVSETHAFMSNIHNQRLIRFIYTLTKQCSLKYSPCADRNRSYRDQFPPEERRPLSYSHLLFSPTLVRFPPEGLGGPGSENMLVELLPPKGLPAPIEPRRPFPATSSPLL